MHKIKLYIVYLTAGLTHKWARLCFKFSVRLYTFFIDTCIDINIIYDYKFIKNRRFYKECSA